MSSRRRPTVVKTLTSSRLAESYEKLIEKKLELLEGLKREHLLRMEILEMNKKLKEVELNAALQGYSLSKKVSSKPDNILDDVDPQIGESVEWTL